MESAKTSPLNPRQPTSKSVSLENFLISHSIIASRVVKRCSILSRLNRARILFASRTEISKCRIVTSSQPRRSIQKAVDDSLLRNNGRLPIDEMEAVARHPQSVSRQQCEGWKHRCNLVDEQRSGNQMNSIESFSHYLVITRTGKRMFNRLTLHENFHISIEVAGRFAHSVIID